MGIGAAAQTAYRMVGAVDLQAEFLAVVGTEGTKQVVGFVTWKVPFVAIVGDISIDSAMIDIGNMAASWRTKVSPPTGVWTRSSLMLGTKSRTLVPATSY